MVSHVPSWQQNISSLRRLFFVVVFFILFIQATYNEMLLHCNCHKYMTLFCCSFSINDSNRLNSTELCSFSNVTLNDDTLLLLLLTCLYNCYQTKQLIQAKQKGRTVQFSSAQLVFFSYDPWIYTSMFV